MGVDIAKEAREMLPPDLRTDGFSNTAYNLNVDLKHVEAIRKWLSRGPLDSREINNYSGISTTVASVGGEFEAAMSYIIEAMVRPDRRGPTNLHRG